MGINEPTDPSRSFDEIRPPDEDPEKARIISPLPIDMIHEKAAVTDPGNDLNYPNLPCSAVVFMQTLAGSLERRTGVLTERIVFRAMADALGFGITELKKISEEVAREVEEWRSIIESMINQLPDQPLLECAHCGRACADTFAVIDEWVLCLADTGGETSCYVQVHEHGVPLGIRG